MMRFRMRKTISLGPLRLNFSQRGFTSWGLRIWRWGWNARTNRQSFDTPGPGGVTWGGRRRS